MKKKLLNKMCDLQKFMFFNKLQLIRDNSPFF